jgi:DNA-binding transcriptional LysR family regulator
VAGHHEPPLPRYRPHGDRGGRYGGEPALLSGCAGAPSGGRERELRSGAGAAEQRARRSAPDHHAARRRPAPVDLKANDLAYWQIYFVVSDAEAAFSAALGGEGALISPGVVALADGRLGFRHGTLARDPDGHAVELAEP